MRHVYLLCSVAMLTSYASAQQVAPYKANHSIVYTGTKYSDAIRTLQNDSHFLNERGGTTYYSEDFESGLTGNNNGTQVATGSWTTAVIPGGNAQVNWEVTTVGHANDAGSTFSIPALQSATGIGASGNWMLLDSDSDGANGVDEEATLTSPAIDFASVSTNTLALEWQQFFGEWENDSLYVEISTDNGSTWSAQTVSDGVGRNGRPNPEYMRIDLTPYALSGQTQVRIRFRWVGQWDYGWQLDDIQIVDLPDHNLRLNSAKVTHSVAHPLAIQAGFPNKIEYTKIPVDQVTNVNFYGRISNEGALTQNNVSMSADLNSGVFTTSSIGVTIPNGTDSTVEAVGSYAVPGTVGSYTVDFDVTYDSVAFEYDVNGLDGSTSFEVTNSEYSRDRDDYTGAGLWNGETASVTNAYQMGHLWQIESTDMLEGISVVLSGSTVPGVIAYASIFEVDTSSGSYDLIQSSSDVDVIGYMVASSFGTGSPRLWIPIQQTLAAGKQYIICLGHYGGADALVVANSTAVDATSYTTFVLDGTDNTWYYLTSTPMIRLHFDTPAWVGIDEVESNHGISLGQNVPNPADSETSISYSLKNAGKVNLEVMDVTGKVVASFSEGYKPAGSYMIDMDLADFAPGVYNYSLTVDNARVTKRMIVTK